MTKKKDKNKTSPDVLLLTDKTVDGLVEAVHEVAYGAKDGDMFSLKDVEQLVGAILSCRITSGDTEVKLIEVVAYIISYFKEERELDEKVEKSAAKEKEEENEKKGEVSKPYTSRPITVFHGGLPRGTELGKNGKKIELPLGGLGALGMGAP